MMMNHTIKNQSKAIKVSSNGHIATTPTLKVVISQKIIKLKHLKPKNWFHSRFRQCKIIQISLSHKSTILQITRCPYTQNVKNRSKTLRNAN